MRKSFSLVNNLIGRKMCMDIYKTSKKSIVMGNIIQPLKLNLNYPLISQSSNTIKFFSSKSTEINQENINSICKISDKSDNFFNNEKNSANFQNTQTQNTQTQNTQNTHTQNTQKTVSDNTNVIKYITPNDNESQDKNTQSSSLKDWIDKCKITETDSLKHFFVVFLGLGLIGALICKFLPIILFKGFIMMCLLLSTIVNTLAFVLCCPLGLVLLFILFVK